MGSNLSQQTAERLYNQIVAEGRLSPGDKLPNEVDLSHELGVSRATLREAIRALTVQGVLEVQRGRGTFVSRQVAEIEDFGFGRLEEIRGRLRDLFELRAIFEPQAARLACVRATEQELAEILTQGERVAARIQAVLQANGIEAEEKSLGEHVYHDIYGGNGAYGREIQVEEEKEAQARAAINAWCSGKETTEKSRNLSGKILIAVAVLLVIILLFLR